MNRLPFLGQGSKVREAGGFFTSPEHDGKMRGSAVELFARGAAGDLASLKMVCLGGNLLLVSFKRCVPPDQGAVRTMVGTSVLFRQALSHIS